MNKGNISLFLRSLRLLYVFDYLRFYSEKSLKRKINKEFKRQNPFIKLPTDYILYESFALNYHSYYNEGKDSAIKLVELLSKYKSLENLNILD